MDYRDVLATPIDSTREGRVVRIAEAIGTIEDGDRVYVEPICGVPLALIDELVAQRERWSRIELVTDYLSEPIAAFDHPGDPFHLLSLQPTGASRAMAEAGALEIIPASYSQFRHVLAPDGPRPIDVALVQVSEPGPDGRFSLGVGAGATADLVRTARRVIAEVNPQMPYTFGASELDRSLIDLLVEVDHPLRELTVPPPDELAQTIGGHAAGEIGDNAVLQFGIGAIPESVLARLADRTDLGMHGGMVGDTVIDLVESGALTGATKSIDRGKLVVGGVIGSRRAFDWVDRNPDVLMVGSSYSHGVPVLALIDNFCAINSALEVALDGSVNAENAGQRIVSGPGGQPDFAVGASLSAGGLSMIAFPSTAARGTLSRIVARLADGVPATTPRYLADRVITEYGVARLRGATLAERAEALRAIAHPDHRDDLGTALRP